MGAIWLPSLALSLLALLSCAPVRADFGPGQRVPNGSAALPFLMWSAGANNGFGQYIPVASLPASALGSQVANTHLAGPASGAAASPTFRGLVTADLPTQLPSSVGVGTLLGPSANGSTLLVSEPNTAGGSLSLNGSNVYLGNVPSGGVSNYQVTIGYGGGGLKFIGPGSTGFSIADSNIVDTLTVGTLNIKASAAGTVVAQFLPTYSSGYASSVPSLLLTPYSAANPALVIQGVSSQSAALLDTINSTGSTHYFQVMPSGHLIMGGTIPTLTNGTNAASATITAGSTDAKGDCTVTTTAAPTAGATLISVVYAAAYATAPEVHIQAYGASAASALLYVSARSTTGFTLTSVNAPPASTTVLFGYMVIQ